MFKLVYRLQLLKMTQLTIPVVVCPPQHSISKLRCKAQGRVTVNRAVNSVHRGFEELFIDKFHECCTVLVITHSIYRDIFEAHATENEHLGA